MHWFGACVIPSGVTYDDAEPYVEKYMAPHREDWSTDNNTGFWDWWQIGGRWTGVWAEYDPTKDPRNIADGSQPYDRIGEVRWSTNWAPLTDDLVPIRLFLSSPPSLFRRPITIITPTLGIERDRWNGSDWDKYSDEEWEEILRTTLKPHINDSLIVVDYHS